MSTKERGKKMKKQLICFLCVGILAGGSIVAPLGDVQAKEINEEVSQDDLYENIIDLEEIEPEEIEPVCEDIAVVEPGEVQGDSEIEEIGASEFDSTVVEEIGKAEIKTELVIGDVAIPLYPVFEDGVAAMQKVKEDCANVLGILAETYGLAEMSDENWKEYYDCALSYLDEPDKVEWYEENNAEYVELADFFDIYENYECNNVLVSEAIEAEDIVELAESDTFMQKFPYYAIEDLEKDGMQISVEDESVGTQIMSCVKSKEQRAGYFKTAYKKANATAYAKQYAVNSNRRKYGVIIGRDCTNFASQILVAGGKIPNSTWYCLPTPAANMYYSPTWCNANKFANYWGVDYKFYTHSVFSQNLKTGDFIAFDKTGDGSWNHIGYVTGVRKSYSKKLGYRNYRVAQHTKNYNAWTSTKENGWDELQSKCRSVRFAIIRI